MIGGSLYNETQAIGRQPSLALRAELARQTLLRQDAFWDPLSAAREQEEW